MQPTDLNQVWPRVTCTFDERTYEVTDNSAASPDGTVRAYFRNLEDRLIQHIREASMVVGCVAWLSHESILRSLADVRYGVALVVQKEDWLRPDLGADSTWKRKLRSLYGSLKVIDRAAIEWPGLIHNLNLLASPEIEPVRCVGNYNREKRPACPRMHNKFLVFCRPEFYEARGECPTFDPKPYALWKGSFNLSHNAVRSLENALFITEPKIVEAYYREWEQIEAISESLNWEADWAEPEWRIGT
jgi:hypothetical protein